MKQLASFGTPLADPISSDSIESALVAAWQAATASADPAHPPARASVLSLIACVVSPTTAADVLDAVHHLTQQHPSRALILAPDATFGDRDLAVWTSTECMTRESFDQPVCVEQIVIAARGEAPRHLPPLADQLVSPDLPTFLWWTGDLPADDWLFRRLVILSDRVIVDSSTFQSLGAVTTRLNRLVHQHAHSAAFSDLSWGRLTPWRELLSQFFDGPALLPRLGGLDRLAIEYDESDGTGPAQAALLLGWFASCLEWNVEGETLPLGSLGDGRLKRGDGGQIEVSIRAAAESGQGGLRRVQLGAGAGASFLVERDQNDDHALTRADVAGAPPVRRIARFESTDLSTALADELMVRGHDRKYEEALAMVDRLAGGVKE